MTPWHSSAVDTGVRMCYTSLMSNTVSTRTICCKLALDSASDTALRATQVAFNQAATYCASVAWEQEVTNKNKLHHIVYGATRATYGLGSQLACCARDKAAEAVRAVRAAPEKKDRKTGEIVPKTCPIFRDDSSIRYDVRTYRLMRLDQVSLYAISGRVVGQMELGDFQRRTLYDRSWKIGGAELIRRDEVVVPAAERSGAPGADGRAGWPGAPPPTPRTPTRPAGRRPRPPSRARR